MKIERRKVKATLANAVGKPQIEVYRDIATIGLGEALKMYVTIKSRRWTWRELLRPLSLADRWKDKRFCEVVEEELDSMNIEIDAIVVPEDMKKP